MCISKSFKRTLAVLAMLILVTGTIIAADHQKKLFEYIDKLVDETEDKVSKENFNQLKMLLEQHKDDKNFINTQNDKGSTLLHITVEHNKQNIAEFLLSMNIDINIQDNNGETALMLAVENENNGMVSLLANNETLDINLQDKLGDSALMIATLLKNDDIVKILLDNKNINTNLQDNNGATALILAIHPIRTAKFGFSYALQEQFMNDTYNKIFPNKYIEPQYKKTDAIVQLLLNNDATNINLSDKQMNTPLIFAVKNYIAAIAVKNNEKEKQETYSTLQKLILNNHIKTDIKNNKDESVLSLANKYDAQNLISLLTKSNIDFFAEALVTIH